MAEKYLSTDPAEGEPIRSSSDATAANVAGQLTAAAPTALQAVEQIATNPGVAKTSAMVGRLMGGAAPIVANPTNPMSYLASSGGAWAGGRAGYFTGQMLQRMAQTGANVGNAVKTAVAGPASGFGALSAEGAVLQRLNSAITARINELRSQGKSYSEAARQAYNETVNR